MTREVQNASISCARRTEARDNDPGMSSHGDSNLSRAARTQHMCGVIMPCIISAGGDNGPVAYDSPACEVTGRLDLLISHLLDTFPCKQQRTHGGCCCWKKFLASHDHDLERRQLLEAGLSMYSVQLFKLKERRLQQHFRAAESLSGCGRCLVCGSSVK